MTGRAIVRESKIVLRISRADALQRERPLSTDRLWMTGRVTGLESWITRQTLRAV
jgi:hypothetical protein